MTDDILTAASPASQPILMWIDPAHCAIHPANTRDLGRAAAHIEDLAASIRSNSQLDPAVGRRVASDRIELLRGACRNAAVATLADQGIPVQLWVLVHEVCDDDRAEAIIANEAARSKTWSGWELSAHYDQLAERHGSNKKVGEKFHLNAANIGRARKVTALPAPVIGLIIDRHEISARAAAGFMTLLGSPGMKAKILTAVDDLAAAYPEGLPADQVFAEFERSFPNAKDVASSSARKGQKAMAATAGDHAATPEMSADHIEIADVVAEVTSLDDHDRHAEAETVLLAIEGIEDKLTREADANDRRADIVVADDVIAGEIVLHDKGSLTVRIHGPLADRDAVTAVGRSIYFKMLDLLGFERPRKT